MAKILKLIPLILALILLTVSCSTAPEIPEVGKAAPNFEIANVNGESISLHDLRGRPVILNFWATYCVPCLIEMPYIQEVHNTRPEEELVILTINVGENPTKVKGFLEHYNFTFPVLLDMTGSTARQYNIRGIPTTYFIDNEGIIRGIKIGALLNISEMEEMLKLITE